MEVLRFALLGLGAGAAYALRSQGLVLIYRGAGIVNFAHGAIGMTGAFLFFEARDVAGLHPATYRKLGAVLRHHLSAEEARPLLALGAGHAADAH